MPRKPATPRTPAGDLHEACLGEALAILAEQGLEKLSLREVARRLGVSHQAPYRHFASRDHLLAEMVQQCFADFAQHIDARPQVGEPHQDLHAMGEAYLDYALRHPLQYRLMFGHVLPDREAHPAMMESAAHAFAQLRGALLRVHGGLRKAGAKRAAELDALYVWSTMHGLATLVQTDALVVSGLPRAVLKEAVQHVIRRIGTGLSGEVALNALEGVSSS